MGIHKLHTAKFGTQEVLVDDEFDYLLLNYSWYLWSTTRHYGIYVNGVSTKNNPYSNKRLHRVIMNAGKGVIVDHINGNPLDNRKQNLRITNSTGNNRNARKRKNSTSIYKGVSKNGKTWKVQIQIDKHNYVLKCGFETEKEAALYYNKLAIEYFGEFAILNKID